MFHDRCGRRFTARQDRVRYLLGNPNGTLLDLLLEDNLVEKLVREALLDVRESPGVRDMLAHRMTFTAIRGDRHNLIERKHIPSIPLPNPPQHIPKLLNLLLIRHLPHILLHIHTSRPLKLSPLLRPMRPHSQLPRPMRLHPQRLHRLLPNFLPGFLSLGIPRIEHALREVVPQVRGDGLERQDLDGAGAEGVAALGGEEGPGGAEDAHFEGHAGGAGGGRGVDGEDGVPPVAAD